MIEAIPQTTPSPELGPQLSDGQIFLRLNQARDHQENADLVTRLRRWSGFPLALAHVVFGENWAVFGAGGVAAGSDGIDGHISRKGQAITTELGLPRIPSNEDDPGADRELVDSLLVAETVREAVIEKDYVSAAVKFMAFTANKVRDHYMAKERARGIEQGKNVDAIGINKFKTDLLLGGAVLELAPLAKKRSGKVLSNSLIVGGVAVGIFGYFKFKKHLNNQPSASAQSCPDFLEDIS